MDERPRPLSVAKALIIGQLIVQGPAVAIMLVVGVVTIAIGYLIASIVPALGFDFEIVCLGSLIAGAIPSWLWWSFMIPRWRKWAIERGAPADRLHKWAVATLLEWPKGSIFEKTEFKVD